jgi:hypothetical protein
MTLDEAIRRFVALSPKERRKRIEKGMATYCRVVRDEKPPMERPEFRVRPEDWVRRIT